jgi:hypothetical protein
MSAKELHFYPGDKVMLWIVSGKVSMRAEAWGGEKPMRGVDYGIMAPRKTTAGTYIIYSYAPYKTKTWPNSRMIWGTPLRAEPDGTVSYQASGNGKWLPLIDHRGRAFKPATLTTWYFELYGEYRFPPTWVFNDFGPWAVRYFRDKDHDGKLSRGEHLSGEMIHTTPDNEAETVKGGPVNLESSHGCIHVKPRERDELARVGAFKRGNKLVVHRYEARMPAAWRAP